MISWRWLTSLPAAPSVVKIDQRYRIAAEHRIAEFLLLRCRPYRATLIFGIGDEHLLGLEIQNLRDAQLVG